MCFDNDDPPKDNSAELARKEAEARQQRILQGQGQIDEQFGIFNPDFFSKFQSDYTNFYNPQVDEQFGDARKSLRYDAARKGTLNSQPSISKFGDLIDAYNQRREEIGSNAISATNQLRGDVENTKSDLYALNTQSADPSLAAQSAVGKVGALTSTPTYSPLGDLFAGFINSGANYAAGKQQALPAGYQQLFTPGATTTGSARVIK